MSDVAMDPRHDELVAELAARGWLGGIYHQQHHGHAPAVAAAHVSLAFGDPHAVQIRLWAVADRPAHTAMWKEYQPHPTIENEFVAIERRAEQPFKKGEGYGAALVLGERREIKSFATAREAVDQLEAWHRAMSNEERERFDQARSPAAAASTPAPAAAAQPRRWSLPRL